MPDVPRDRSDAPARSAALPFEREQVVARLSELFAQDVLPIEEFERRVTVAYRATTLAELNALTADLPATPSARDDAVIRSPRLSAAVRASKISAFFANIERGGFMEMPPRLEIRVFAGNVELDLTQARFAPGSSEISVRSVLGNVELKLPAGVRVESEGSGIFGSFESRVGATPTGGEDSRPVVRITGRAILGNVETTVVDVAME